MIFIRRIFNLGTDIAPEMFGVDQSFYIEDIREFMTQNITEHPDSLIYYDSCNPPAIPLHKTFNNLLQKDGFKVFINIVLRYRCMTLYYVLRLKYLTGLPIGKTFFT